MPEKDKDLEVIEGEEPEETPEPEPKKEDKEKEWDKQKQLLDQERANSKKAREEAESLSAALEDANARLSQLEQGMKAKQEAIDKESQRLEDLDPALVDFKVIKNFDKMKSQLEQLSSQVAAQQREIDTYKGIETERWRETDKQKTINKILAPLDEEFGAKYRNEAIKLADQLINDGAESQPQDAIEAFSLMRKCFKTLAEKDTKKPSPKKIVPADSGTGGIPFLETTKKQGTIEEVLADMRKNPTWRE